MKKVRIGTFETNSSSTHSLVICSKDEYEAYKNDKMVWDTYDDVLVKNPFTNKEEFLKDKITKLENGYVYENKYYKTKEEILDSVEIDDYRYRKYGTYSELESYYQEYTSKSGDEIVVFGEYGNDY